MKITNLTQVFMPKIQFKGVENPQKSQQVQDVFVKTDKSVFYEAELNRLFTNGELEQIYSKILDDFKIDNPPRLSFVTVNDKVQGGGFAFFSNTITFDLANLLGNDAKIVGLKDGKEHNLITPFEKLPAFLDTKTAQFSLPFFAKNKVGGFESYGVKPLTDEDKRKFIIQQIAHEVIHAQQHMMMRKTQGIGDKNIIKAWLHQTPKNPVESFALDRKVEEIYKHTPWASIETQQSIPKNSKFGKQAYEWLDAVQNYPRVDSPQYKTNKLETDAYNRSAKYLQDNYGGWD